MSSPVPQYQLPGRALLASVVAAYEPYRAPITRSSSGAVVIVRLDSSAGSAPGWRLRMEAARISADQKQRLFGRLGARPGVQVLPDTAPPAQLDELIAAANFDPGVAAVIVQTPLPRRLVPLLDRIAPAKDIDALGVDAAPRVSATADGVVRILAPFLSAGTTVAVVGGRGFVGSGVVALLRQKGLTPAVLDVGDDLAAVADVDLVVSSSGRAGLLTAAHLHSAHRLVVDTGFVPLPGGPVGDVHHDAQQLPAAITPVPGGVGPVEMAVLAERLVTTLAAPDLHSWAYLGPEAPRLTNAAHTVAVQLAAHRPAGRGRPGLIPPPTFGHRGGPPHPPPRGHRRR